MAIERIGQVATHRIPQMTDASEGLFVHNGVDGSWAILLAAMGQPEKQGSQEEQIWLLQRRNRSLRAGWLRGR